MLLIEEVAMHINTAGIGVYDPNGDTGDVYLGILPDTPAEIVSIFPRGGGQASPPVPYSETNASVQVIVRSIRRLDGFIKGQAIIDSMNGIDDTLVTGGMHIIDISTMQGEPADLGMNQAGQYEWSINFSIDYYKK